MATIPYLFQLQDIRQMHRWCGRVLYTADMGCLHPNTLLQCQHTKESKTVLQWYGSKNYPWLNGYDPLGNITCIQADGLSCKYMEYLRVVLEDGRSVTVGKDHLFLTSEKGVPSLTKAIHLQLTHAIATILTQGIKKIEGVTDTTKTFASSTHVSLLGTHFIPINFQNLQFIKIQEIEKCGEGLVVDLTMPGIGNYFDAEGINHQNTGKTVSSLLYALRHPEIRPIVVVCPATLKWSWQQQANQHVGIRSEVLEGTRPNERSFPNESPMYIINYDILGKTRNGPGWVKWLIEQKPQLVILDEIQAIGEPRSKRSIGVAELCKNVPQVIGLSGTPFTNRPIQLWFPLHVIRPDMFPSRFTYGCRWCNGKRGFFGWDFQGASHLDELNSILTNPESGVMIRRRKEDVLAHLPYKQRTVIPVDIVDRSQYDKAVNNFMCWLRENAPGKLHKAAKATAVVQLGYLKRLAAQLKLKSVYNWVDDFLLNTEEKLILFAIHKSIIKNLKERYGKQCVVVDGSVTGKNRQYAIDKFLKNNQTRLFLGNVQAAGVGWSAQGVSHVVFCEFPWDPGSVVQGEDRVVGIGRGQKGVHAQIYFLTAKGTVEEKLVEIIQKKAKIITAVLDGSKKIKNTLRIYDELIRELRKSHKTGK